MAGRNASATGARARWAIGLAAAGVLGGHGLTYALVHPDGHERAGVLASTGHAYLHLLEGPGIVLALASVLAAAAVGFGRLGPAPDRGALFRRLAAVQVVAFAAMEVAERIGAGVPSVGPSDAALLFVGISIQLFLARLGAWVLDAARRGGERLALAFTSAAPPLPRPAFRIPVPLVATPVVAAPGDPRSARGPPLRRR